MRLVFTEFPPLYRPLRRYETEHTPRSEKKSSSQWPQITKLHQWIMFRTALVLCAFIAFAHSVSSDLLTRINNHGTLTAEQLKAIPLGGSSSSSSSDNHSIPADGDRRLRIFMSADSPHINLCKSVMSAVAVGYPAPILLNWAGEFNHAHRHLAGRPAAKLEGLLAVIDDLLARAEGEDSDVHEEDLAVLVDAHHVWFQLPPSVLIQKYHQLNREADQRLHWQWDPAQGNRYVPMHATDQFPIKAPRQSIVVTTTAAAAMAKDCQPKVESGSTPSSDYGYRQGREKIFSPPSSSSSPSSTCLNLSGAMVMGTMASLRDVLRRAKAKLETATQSGRETWSDQTLLGVLASVLREQDMWRAWMRDLGNTWNGTASQNDLSRLPRPVRAVAKASMAGERFEFGLGLDLAAADDDRLSMIPSVADANGHARYGGAFVKISNVTALQEAATKAGLVSDGHARLRGVPDELSQKKVGSTDLAGIQWGDVPLYSDLYHGVTPVGLYFDDDNNNNKRGKDKKDTRLVDWWAKMWFHPRLRTLVAHAMTPLSQDSTIRPLARIPTQSPTSPADRIRYWAPKYNYRNPKVQVFEPHTSVEGHSSGGSYNAITWEGICQGNTKIPWHEEIFSDKKGPWQL